MKTSATIAIELLESVLMEFLTPHEALKKWPEFGENADLVVGNAYHQLYHYMADEDIRKNDCDYAQAQKALLRDCIIELTKFSETDMKS